MLAEIILHLDTDAPGRLGVETIKALLPFTYTVTDEPPRRGERLTII